MKTYVHVTDRFRTDAEAFHFASGLLDDLGEDPPLEVIGDFVIPPADGSPSRDFQALHIDFGLPLAPRRPADIGRYTALYMPADRLPTAAVTRLVPLAALLGDRGWPSGDELIGRLEAYGRSHGAWADADGYIEGILGRIVEAVDGAPVLPSVKEDPEFLCGTEFASIAEETSFFWDRGIDIARHKIEIALQPGELLVFDNLAVAHGRRGGRKPEELRQRIYGWRDLPVADQFGVRDRTLAAFCAQVP